jgi:transketolase
MNQHASHELGYIREGFGKGIVQASRENDSIVALCADLTESVKLGDFRKEFPHRFFEVGITEQNMASVASGMAAMGKIPFMASYAMFSPGRNWEQIRTTICYNDVNVKIVGAHAGVSVGPDGGTHQALEDIALMRIIPRMTVVVPCDTYEAEKATQAIARTNNPSYIRLAREKTPILTTSETPFTLGTAYTMFDSGTKEGNKKVGIIACGTLVYNAIEAGKRLANEGFEVAVLNMHTIKPLDTDAIDTYVTRFGKIITCEEHQIAGGLGSAISEYTSTHVPVPIRHIGVHDSFGQSGTQEELFKHYKLTSEDIIREAQSF